MFFLVLGRQDFWHEIPIFLHFKRIVLHHFRRVKGFQVPEGPWARGIGSLGPQGLTKVRGFLLFLIF